MSRIPELFEEIAESIAGFGEEMVQSNRAAREYQDIENERAVEGLYKNDPLLLEALFTAGTLPVAGATALKYATGGGQLPKWLAPYTRRGSSGQLIREPGLFARPHSRFGTDAAGRAPMPKSKTPAPTNRGPRGNTNIDRPVQRNLDLSDLKPTGIQNTTQARGINPKMRESLTTRRDNIQQDIFKMESQGRLNESVDMQKLFRLQDELKALNKTLD